MRNADGYRVTVIDIRADGSLRRMSRSPWNFVTAIL